MWRMSYNRLSKHDSPAGLEEASGTSAAGDGLAAGGKGVEQEPEFADCAEQLTDDGAAPRTPGELGMCNHIQGVVIRVGL